MHQMSGEMRGAFVISLDFELYWGVRDHRRLDPPERKRLLAARSVVPKILAAFRDHEIRATWATVGLLFARSREEAYSCRPEHVPSYRQAELDPYVERMGRDESEDPFRFAPSLIRVIEQEAGQEIGSHSYSHYYSLEEGQSEKEFKADIAGAIRIAENSGYQLRSYVFPRNQVSRHYLPILRQAGFHAYRGTEPAASKTPVTYREQRRPWLRVLRLADTYWDLNGPQTVAFPKDRHLARLGASRYLRPFSPALSSLESMRLHRIATAMKSAAREGRIFHLWWHPEDFAGHPDRNIDFLHRVLNMFDKCRNEDGMASLSMGDVGRMSEDSATVRFNGEANR
jgi:peptidoglycan/xylan/chitin deacetylase (PgdA/CDA1 family)